MMIVTIMKTTYDSFMLRLEGLRGSHPLTRALIILSSFLCSSYQLHKNYRNLRHDISRTDRFKVYTSLIFSSIH